MKQGTVRTIEHRGPWDWPARLLLQTATPSSFHVTTGFMCVSFHWGSILLEKKVPVGWLRFYAEIDIGGAPSFLSIYVSFIEMIFFR
jgi:hypothetical protein